MSSRGRSRGRGYFGRGSSSATYRHREEPQHSGSHRGGGGGMEHHNSHYRGAHFNHRGGGGAAGGEYVRHKEMAAAPPHHASREHHSSRGDERYHHHSRSSSTGDRGYEHHSAGSSRRSPPPQHHRRPSPPPPPRRPEHILAKLAPDEQVALTKALVATVLRGSEGRDGGRGYREERGDMRGMRDERERGFREDVAGRDYRERRPPSFVAGASPRYHQGRGGYREDRGRAFYRGRTFRGGPRGGHHDLGPHQRLSIPFRGQDGTGVRRRYADYEQSEQPYKRQRLDSSSAGASDTAVTSVKGEPRGSQDRDTDEDDSASKADDGDAVKATSADAAAGSEAGDKAANTTARQGGESDERPVRRDSWYKQFVELECPHCPSHCSITYKEYKQHLMSDQHLRNMDRLANRQSMQLLRIRKEQRLNQKKVEDSYLQEHPDQGEISVSRFCGICKLNFRCLGGDVKEGVNNHRNSRLHKIQYSYVHPRCLVCHEKGEEVVRFNTRMVYEHHLASIPHMKRKAEKLEQFPEETGEEDDNKALDGFMTLDSVGEDLEAGYEQDDAAAGEGAAEADEASVKAEPDQDEDEADLHKDEDEGGYEPVGLSYVKAIKTYYCRLCYLNVKEEGVKHHCTTPSHRNKYFKARDAALAAAAATAAASAASSTAAEEGSESRPAGEFPRSGGRAGSRDEEDEEEEEDASKESGKSTSSTRPGNGEKAVHEEAMDQDGNNDDKDDSEKSYEDYNDKYEFPEPRQEDYEEEMDEEGVEEEEEEDDLWDYQMSKRSKKENEECSDDEEETTRNGGLQPRTSSTQERSGLTEAAPDSKRSQKEPDRKEESHNHQDAEEEDEEEEQEEEEQEEESPKPMRRRLRSARKVVKEDKDEEEEELDMTTAEEEDVEEREVAKEKVSTKVDPEKETRAEDVDTDED